MTVHGVLVAARNLIDRGEWWQQCPKPHVDGHCVVTSIGHAAEELGLRRYGREWGDAWKVLSGLLGGVGPGGLSRWNDTPGRTKDEVLALFDEAIARTAPKKRRTRPPDERLWEKAEEQPNGCWQWTAKTDKDGYGSLKVDGHQVRAHRFAYELVVGVIPLGLTIHHKCGNPGCINPAHLEAMTMRENTLRGKTLPAANAAKTHCLQGHPLSGDNLVRYNGRRHCRECRRRAAAERLPARIASGETAEYQRRYRQRHGEKARARAAVKRAVERGALARAVLCEQCGAEADVQGHHDDYAQPLVVRWLCRSCHVEADKALRTAPPPEDLELGLPAHLDGSPEAVAMP